MLFWLIGCQFQPNPSQSVWHHPRALKCSTIIQCQKSHTIDHLRISSLSVSRLTESSGEIRNKEVAEGVVCCWSGGLLWILSEDRVNRDTDSNGLCKWSTMCVTLDALLSMYTVKSCTVCLEGHHPYTAWCSEAGSLTSLDACNTGASSDRREPISLNQAVQYQESFPKIRVAI